LRPEGGFGLYVHWPFCAAKCPYCDFNSHVRRAVDAMAFARGLVREMETQAAALDTRTALDTMFFGGGTPSLMPPEAVALVIEAARRLFGFVENPEITLEANPTSAEAEKFRSFAEAGVNRLSMGVQALNDRHLKALGRMHTAGEAMAAFGLARAVFPRISFDLIYARPGQTEDDWAEELQRAIALAADHLSLYQLTIEDGTPFRTLHERGALVTPGDEEAARLYDLTQAICAAAGMAQYEISNHARAGAQSRHNLIYWRYGTFLGIGPGAHGRVRRAGALSATVTERQPERWLSMVEARGEGLVACETVPEPVQAEEYLLMALRLAEGADTARYTRLAGRAPEPARVGLLTQEGLLEPRSDRLIATAQGRLVLNALVAELAR
jgi:putative oxygen-independent coproporphyrinogen III oxidase